MIVPPQTGSNWFELWLLLCLIAACHGTCLELSIAHGGRLLSCWAACPPTIELPLGWWDFTVCVPLVFWNFLFLFFAGFLRSILPLLFFMFFLFLFHCNLFFFFIIFRRFFCIFLRCFSLFFNCFCAFLFILLFLLKTFPRPFPVVAVLPKFWDGKAEFTEGCSSPILSTSNSIVDISRPVISCPVVTPS